MWCVWTGAEKLASAGLPPPAALFGFVLYFDRSRFMGLRGLRLQACVALQGCSKCQDRPRLNLAASSQGCLFPEPGRGYMSSARFSLSICFTFCPSLPICLISPSYCNQFLQPQVG